MARSRFLKGVVLGSIVSSVALVSSMAFAGTGVGGVFNLGRVNNVNGPTTLSGSTAGKQLQVTNTNTGVKATGIGITTPAAVPPLAVSSKAVVKNLDADLLGGHDPSEFQRTLQTSCGSGTAITAVDGNGVATCSTSAVVPIVQPPGSGSV